MSARLSGHRRILQCSLGVCLAAVSATGCDKLGRAAAATTAAPMSAGEVLVAFRPHLVTIQTQWQTGGTVLTARRPQSRAGVGVIVAADGERALILTTRRLVDPGYGPSPSAGAREVTFRVWTDANRRREKGVNARLVAVFMNEEDLALLRIPAADIPAITIPIARAGQLPIGESVTLISQSGRGVALGNGLISERQPNNRTGGHRIGISVDAGSAPAGAVVISRQGGRLAAIVQTRQPGGAVVQAVSADLLCHPRRWDCLIDARTTRRLLAGL